MDRLTSLYFCYTTLHMKPVSLYRSIPSFTRPHNTQQILCSAAAVNKGVQNNEQLAYPSHPREGKLTALKTHINRKQGTSCAPTMITPLFWLQRLQGNIILDGASKTTTISTFTKNVLYLAFLFYILDQIRPIFVIRFCVSLSWFI